MSYKEFTVLIPMLELYEEELQKSEENDPRAVTGAIEEKLDRACVEARFGVSNTSTSGGVSFAGEVTYFSCERGEYEKQVHKAIEEFGENDVFKKSNVEFEFDDTDINQKLTQYTNTHTGVLYEQAPDLASNNRKQHY